MTQESEQRESDSNYISPPESSKRIIEDVFDGNKQIRSNGSRTIQIN